MQVLIYNNKEKDVGGKCKDDLINILVQNNINYLVLNDDMLCEKINADVLFAIGGDGTILYLAEFANKNSIPIVGINAGKLGFLCEFEKNEIDLAVEGVKNNSFSKDYRTMISVNINNQTFYALNDVYVQRSYDRSVGNLVAELEIEIDKAFVSRYAGDGAIITSPTGSTAYSFSLGAPILSPDSDVFTMTPIAAHSFNQRPVVFSSDSTCVIKVLGKSQVGLFVDGKHVFDLNQNNKVEITKVDKNLLFLRKKDYNFFNRLCKKLAIHGEDKND